MLFKDEILLLMLDNLKKESYYLTEMLEGFRAINKSGLLNVINEAAHIKPSTKEKFEQYFTEVLENEIMFDTKLEKKGIKTEYNSEFLDYKSDEYNISQKGKDILEIENTRTGEKKVVDFKKILDEDLNGINDIIKIKTMIQNLPPEVIFKIPDEVSQLSHIDVYNLFGLNDTDAGGLFLYNKDKSEWILTSDSMSTLIHEISHAVFFNAEGVDTLEQNKEIVDIYNKAVNALKQEGRLESDMPYWSKDISEFGAEIVSAVLLDDGEVLDEIEKYAPEALKLVMDSFKARENATDKMAIPT